MSDAEWVELKRRIDARLELVINPPRHSLTNEFERSCLRIPASDRMTSNVAHLLEV
jgi:hypothetical protein